MSAIRLEADFPRPLILKRLLNCLKLESHFNDISVRNFILSGAPFHQEGFQR